MNNVRYVVFPHHLKVQTRKTYYITAGNSSVKDYLVGYRLFSENTIESMSNINSHTYFQGMEQCFKLSLWDRIRLPFGADESKIYTELRDETAENPFYRYILDYSIKN